MAQDPRSTWAYTKARTAYLNWLRLQGDPVNCHHCGKPVDLARRYRNKRTGKIDPWSPTIEHTTPLHRGGAVLDTSTWAIAHHRCNSRQGAQATNQRRKRIQRHSRRW